MPPLTVDFALVCLEEMSRGKCGVEGEAGGGKEDSELDKVLDKEEESESVVDLKENEVVDAFSLSLVRLSLMVSM